MERYSSFEHNNHIIYISQINGNQIMIPKSEHLSQKELVKLFRKNLMDVVIPTPESYDADHFHTIYISLHISNACNMNCKYCFSVERQKQSFSFDEGIRFIDMIISRFPNAHKFIVDPTGSGEPLLKQSELIRLADYCHKKSDEINKEVLPMFVTNGTLLTSQIVDEIQSAGYIFGVSIDGYKKPHNRNRINRSNQGTYNQILKNIKQIKHRDYLGAAVTLSNETMNLVKVYKNLTRYFTTISVKPVRSFSNTIDGIRQNNIERIKKNYTALNNYLIKSALSKQFKALFALLNGDDYYGKFLLRVIINQKVSTRCDAGLGRFSLTPDKKIIACPGSIGIKELELGTLETGIRQEAIDNLWAIMMSQKQCSNCDARYVCGGECLIVSYYQNGTIDSIDPVMCELKRHLFKLAIIFKFELMLHSDELLMKLYNWCNKKASRNDQDKDLFDTLTKLNGAFSFMELKKIKDDDYPRYLEIKREVNNKIIKT